MMQWRVLERDSDVAAPSVYLLNGIVEHIDEHCLPFGDTQMNIPPSPGYIPMCLNVAPSWSSSRY